MGPQKQSINFNFGQGLELKQDPKQIPVGKFLDLQNAVFNKGGLFQKRNGFGELTVLPNLDSTYITTFNNNLTAISDSILAFSTSNDNWISKGSIQPVNLKTLPLIRSTTNQSQADISISSNNLICTVYTDQDLSNTANVVYKYVVADATTGQNIIEPTIIPASNGGTLVYSPRVFNIGAHFIILFTNHISGAYHLQFIAISTSVIGTVTSPVDVTNSYIASQGLSFDATVLNDTLYIAYDTTSGGQAIQTCYINKSLQISSKVTYPGFIATLMGLNTDGNNVYAAFYDSNSQNGYLLSFNGLLQTQIAPVQIITGLAVLNITPTISNGVCDVYYEVSNGYTYDTSIRSNFIQSVPVPISVPTPGMPITIVRGVGLASKAFTINNTEYFLSAYNSEFQPTYFLINGTESTEAAPIVTAKLAYSNGGGYLSNGLPNVVLSGTVANIPYLIKDLVESVNKGTNLPSGSQVGGIYSQTGINYTTFNISTQKVDSVEIASSLHLSGGFLWQYDGYLPVEHNFLIISR